VQSSELQKNYKSMKSQGNKLREKEKKRSSQNRDESAFEKSFLDIMGGRVLSRNNTRKFLPFLLFLALLAVFYIGNTYYAEKKNSKTNKLKKELKELRYDYITSKSELMFHSKQSEIVKKLSSTGIKESKEPPKKIHLEKDEK